MFNAVIFDFDGVILDSEPLHYEACRQVLQDLGIKLTFKEYLAKYTGVPDREMFPPLLISRGIYTTPEEINAIVQQKIKYYTNIIENHDNLPVVAGLEQFIDNLIIANKKIAICSGSSIKEVESVLKHIVNGRLQSCFEIIVTSEKVKNGKPSPEGYLLTAKLLNVMPQHCLVIEDANPGIQAAKKAGMYVIAVLTTHDREFLLAANQVVEDLTKIDIDAK